MKACQLSHDLDSALSAPNHAAIYTTPVSANPRLQNDWSDSTYVGVRSDFRNEERDLNNILTSLPVAVITLDTYGHVSFCNDMAVKLFELPLEGQLWRNLIESCFAEQLNNDELVLRNGRIVKLDTSPLQHKCGQVLVFSDVTKDRDIKNIREHYARLAELGEMAASLAHQIRTPLAASMLFISNIRKSLNKTDSTYSSLEKGLSGLRHIGSMIEDMLLFSKGGRKGNDILKIENLVEELEQETVVLINEYGCEINIYNKTEDKCISVNRHAVKSAISNIIVNAAQACKCFEDKINSESDIVDAYESKVIIEINNKNNNECSPVVITVSDNGIGISDEMLARIKEPFYTTKSNGTGLGLAVTKSVIEAHGGVMNIKSTVMKGTVVEIILP